jgi:NAD(P)-dependent dehydrogenase (short-subunit alcohol dehydrogenase family)
MTNLFDLTGKVACVTGASGGLGRHAATVLSRAGAQVVGVARRQDQLDAWAEGLEGVATVAADLSDPEQVPYVLQTVCRHFAAPDILINAAGINTRSPADTVTLDDWNLTQALNLSTPFFLAQGCMPAMKEKGWGRIINFASLQSRRAFANGIAYGASKGGVEQMTRAMAEAWSASGINANAIAPGFFETELTAPVFGDAAVAAHHAAQTCIGRNGALDDLDGPLLFLCSDASRYVTGQVLFVDGGYTAK